MVPVLLVPVVLPVPVPVVPQWCCRCRLCRNGGGGCCYWWRCLAL
jgi:hypothetical protein